ncbi:MAG TPA: AmmeMemoRadiSam system protein B [Sedimentisphaerales bacterium]|nr:AmmeMemoRadiSam system protein B [Sedimentisphaerales bacterium]
MRTRKPIVAGQFYPAQHHSCIHEINQCLDAGAPSDLLPETILAGIVPHAGWTFSGPLAALVFAAIRQQHEKVHTFVIFGAAHGYFGASPAVCASGVWETPLGEAAIDEELADIVLSTGSAVNNPEAHLCEHSIEVQVPFIQYLFAGARILPILVPPTDAAVALGTHLGEIISMEEQKKIVCLGSTDLTHYGPRYGFTPKGTDNKALEWAEKVNDKEFIDLALTLDAAALLANAAQNCNACGPGAAAATVAAAKRLGCLRGLLLGQTTSNHIMLERMGTTSADSVGYAAIVF